MESLAKCAKTWDQVEIDSAFCLVKQEIERNGGAQDLGYFGHEARYRRTIGKILELVSPGATILDVGSHFLHQAEVLSYLGYRVLGMDVPEFADLQQIKNRALKFNIHNCVVDRFDRGDFLAGYEDQIDLVVFTEIQEHITFNPIQFWHRIWQLLKIGGKIYLTTPNSLTVWKIASACKKMLLLKGIGIGIEDILRAVTYGHHWKEYSAYELRLLFEMLSPDWSIEITPYDLTPLGSGSKWEDLKGLKPRVREIVRRTSSLMPRFKEQLEAVITLRQRSVWQTKSPDYF